MSPIDSDSLANPSAAADFDDGLGISPADIAEVLRSTGQSPSFVGMTPDEVLAARRTSAPSPADADPPAVAAPAVDDARWVEVEEQPAESAAGAESAAELSPVAETAPPTLAPPEFPVDPFDELDEIAGQVREAAPAPAPVESAPVAMVPEVPPLAPVPAAAPVTHEPAPIKPAALPTDDAAPTSKAGRILAMVRGIVAKLPLRKIAGLIVGNKFVAKAIHAIPQNALVAKLKSKLAENKFVAKLSQNPLARRIIGWGAHNRIAAVLLGAAVVATCLAWSSAAYHAGISAWRSGQLSDVEARAAALEAELNASHTMASTYEVTAKAETQAAAELRARLEEQSHKLADAEAEVARLQEIAAPHAAAAAHDAASHHAAQQATEQVDAAIKRLALERREAYDLQLALVREIIVDDPGRALTLLDDETKCPADLRDFAWRYDRALAAHDRQTIRGHAGAVLSCLWSPDGQTLITAGVDKTVRFWNLATGGHWDGATTNSKPLVALATSADRTLCLTSSADQSISFWQVGEQSLAAKWTGKTSNVAALALSPDGTLAATAGVEWPIQLWNTQNGAVEAVLIGHAGEVDAVAFSPDGRTLTSVSRDGTVRWWDVAAHKLKATRRLSPTTTESLEDAHAGVGGSIAYSRDGKLLATSGQGTIRLWQAETGELLGGFSPESGAAQSLEFDPEATLLAVADGYSVTEWNVASGQMVRRRMGHADDVRALAYSPDGQSLASVSADGTIKLWDAGDSQQERSIARNLDDSLDPSSFVTAGSHGDVLAVARGNRVEIWDSRRAWKIVSLPPQTGPVRRMAVSPDGSSVAIATDEWPVFVWGVESRRLQGALNGHTNRVTSLDYSPSGKWLATASADHTVRLWDARTGALVGSLAGHGDAVLRVLFSPDEATIFTATTAGHLHFWNADARTEKLMLETHHEVVDMAIAPAGDVLALASADGTVSLWDPVRMEQITQYAGRPDSHTRLGFSPDGKTLTHAAGGVLSLRDPVTGRLRVVLAEPGMPMADATFARDGATLYGAGERGLTVWSIPERHDIDATATIKTPEQPTAPDDEHAPHGEPKADAHPDSHAAPDPYHAPDHGHAPAQADPAAPHADSHGHDTHPPAAHDTPAHPAPSEPHDDAHPPAAHPAPAAAPAHGPAEKSHDDHHAGDASHH